LSLPQLEERHQDRGGGHENTPAVAIEPMGCSGKTGMSYKSTWAVPAQRLSHARTDPDTWPLPAGTRLAPAGSQIREHRTRSRPAFAHIDKTDPGMWHVLKSSHSLRRGRWLHRISKRSPSYPTKVATADQPLISALRPSCGSRRAHRARCVRVPRQRSSIQRVVGVRAAWVRGARRGSGWPCRHR
jgi:hypothetical protein